MAHGTILYMKKKHQPLVVGNWKMNPLTIEKSYTLFTGTKKALGSKYHTVEVVIAPSFVAIAGIHKLAKKSVIALGAQDVFYESSGAYTGEISIPMLKPLGVSHIIVGHSERRALGESDELVGKKVAAVVKSGLTCIVCIGEKIRDAHGMYFNVIEAQLRAILTSVSIKQLSHLVIAYEPIWAIGTGKNATAEDVQEMKLFIQKNIVDMFNRAAAAKVRIIYGGSVNPENAEVLLATGDADGFLVGGASLKPVEFARIVQISHEHGNKKT